MHEKFWLLGTDFVAEVEYWEGDFTFPFVVHVREPGQVNGFQTRTFRTAESVEQWYDMREELTGDRERFENPST